MRLFRHGDVGRERPGALDADGGRRDLSAFIDDLAGDMLSPDSLDRLRAVDLSRCPVIADDVRLGACVGRVRHFIGVGLNYADHAAETKLPLPTEPSLFNKAPSCIVGSDDDVRIPVGSLRTDWEAELAVVIGAPAFAIGEAEADGVIAGYCICNDVSERAFQFDRGGQFLKGKGCPTFGPLGPLLVTPDTFGDPQDKRIWLTVNGETRQDSSTAQMVFTVRQIVAYVSQFLALEPGDVITTGTPAGVALGMVEPRYLRDGDVVELGVEGLGTQRQRLIATPSRTHRAA